MRNDGPTSNSLPSQQAKAQEEACRREVAEMALEKIKAELDEERRSYHELLAQPTAKAQEEACRREAAEMALEKIKAELDEERRSYHELLAQPTAKAQEEACRREAAETALEKIKAELDEERRSYHELWVRHEEQGCEIFVLKEEVQQSRAELKEAKNMDSQHSGEFDEWKQKAQLEQEELRRRLQNSEETIRRAAEKEAEQAKLLEDEWSFAHRAGALEVWRAAVQGASGEDQDGKGLGALQIKIWSSNNFRFRGFQTPFAGWMWWHSFIRFH